MENSGRSPDPWWVAFTATALLVTGLLLAADRYAELLGAVVAYAATWAIVRHERPEGHEEEISRHTTTTVATAAPQRRPRPPRCVP